MARGGTNVGNAYVSVTADGRGINEEIVDAVDEAGPDVKKAGKQHGEDYGDEFGDSLRVKFSHAADGASTELNRRLSDSADDGAKDYGISFEKRMKKMSKRIGQNVGKSIGKELSKSLEDTIARIADVSGNGGGGGRPPTAPAPGGGGQAPLGSKQTLYRELDIITKFEAARIALQKRSNQSILDHDSALLKDQQKLMDRLTRENEKAEKQRAGIVEKFVKARVQMQKQSNAAILKADEDLIKTQQRLFDKLKREKAADDKRAQNVFDLTGKAHIKFWADVEKTRIKAEKRIEAKRKAAFEAGGKAQLAFWADVEKTRIAAEKRIASKALQEDAKLWAVRNATAKAHYKYLADLEKGRIDKKGNTIPGGGTRDRDLGTTIGNLFGKGSRNNFLNLFGSTLGGLVGMVDKVRKGAVGLFTTFAKGWSQAAEGASVFQKFLGGAGAVGTRMGTGLANIAKAGPAAAVGIVLVVTAMSAMVSVMSALLAIVTALTSAIVSALTGALIVLGGAFVAAAAAAGLLVVAFTSMTDAQSKMLSSAFKPLKAELTGLGQLMIREMIPHFKTWSQNLQEALALAGPLGTVMGKAFGEAGDRLTASLSGPGFRNFFDMMRTELPTITRRLSSALGGFMNGLMGVFTAIMPLVTQFSGWLNRVAQDFSKWANSAGGQNKIKDFADRAVESLKAVWGFVKEFVGFVTDVLFSKQAQNSGNTMFDSLADSFEGFRKKIQQWIDDGTLEKWFKRAEKFGGQFKDLVIALKNAFVKLDNSGVLDAVGDGIETLAGFIEDANKVLGPLVDYIGVVLPKMISAAKFALDNFTFPAVLGRLQDLYDMAVKVGNALASIRPGDHRGESLDGAEQNTAPPASGGGPVTRAAPGAALDDPRYVTGGKAPVSRGGRDWQQHLIDIGNQALANTSEENGGTGGGGGGDGGKGGKGGGGDKKWHNPFIKFANSLIKDGPSIARQLSNAMTNMLKQVQRSLTAAAKAADIGEARAIITDQMLSLRQAGKDGVRLAQDALNSAAENLKSASGPKEAQRALKAVHKAQEDLKTANKNQKELNKAAALLDKQKKQNNAGALGLVGDKASIEAIKALDAVQNKTLADFAATRARAAILIESANSQLQDAIQLRDSFTQSVSDSAKAFGALTTAQASIIDGVEQTLSAGDITANLQTRLDKIKTFQENLRKLLALGLSNEAYKQIVDAGVEGGSAYAEALLAGGGGAVGQVNGLVGQISTVADQLGVDAGTRMYQAGVDAAQGLVDGLTSLSAQLDSAAAALGLSIAKAVKKALGIKSPSTVMFAAMGFVGDGLVMGLDAQQAKVGIAAERLSGQIAVSPEVAQYAARQGTAVVSGNPVNDITLTVVTPTEDPHAVAMEVLNEVTGRLV